MTKIQTINTILEPTNFRCRVSGHKFIFERTKNDGIFIPDFTVARNFKEALPWALETAKCYK